MEKIFASDIKFIRLVEKETILYDKRSGWNKGGKNWEKKCEIWRKIAKKMNLSDELAARKKWRCLREKYVMLKKDLDWKRSKGELIDVEENWPPFKYLRFLDDYLRSRNYSDEFKFGKEMSLETRYSFDIQFIKLVQQEPVLYDEKLSAASHNDQKNAIWSCIALKMGYKDETVAISKFRYLRDKYIRLSREMKDKSILKSVNDCASKWTLYKHLYFLDQHIKSKIDKRFTDIDEQHLKSKERLELDLKFIKLVKRHPILYQRYSGPQDEVTKNKLWQKVAKQMRYKDVDRAIKKWRYLRDKYTKTKKNLDKLKLEEVEDLEVWHLYEVLAFLEPHVRARNTTHKKECMFKKAGTKSRRGVPAMNETTISNDETSISTSGISSDVTSIGEDDYDEDTSNSFESNGIESESGVPHFPEDIIDFEDEVKDVELQHKIDAAKQDQSEQAVSGNTLKDCESEPNLGEVYGEQSKSNELSYLKELNQQCNTQEKYSNDIHNNQTSRIDDEEHKDLEGNDCLKQESCASESLSDKEIERHFIINPPRALNLHTNNMRFLRNLEPILNEMNPFQNQTFRVKVVHLIDEVLKSGNASTRSDRYGCEGMHVDFE